MRIALVRKDYTRAKGGAEGYTVALSFALAAAGHEVHVFASNIEAEQARGIRFHLVPVPRARTFLRHVWFARNAERLLRQDEFDIINGLSRIWWQDIYRSGDPLFIHWLRCHPPNIIDRVLGPLNPKQRIMLSIERKVFRSSSLRRVIAISEMDSRLIERYYGIAPEKIKVIYNGVDHRRFNPGNRVHLSEVRSRLGVPRDAVLLLFVGMDFKRKGLCYLLDALRLLGPELRRVHCLVVSGDDPRKYRLQALRDGTGPHVTFAPATEQIGEVYAAADIFAFPTLYDPFANVHLEALASGLPVITTASAGGAEVIRNGENGFVVPHAQDTKRMAECVLELLDSQARLRMSENAARSAGSFTIERNVREVASLYEEVFAEKGRC